MLADERKQIILQQLGLKHSVTVSELVDLLHVSTETIRRDFEDLENNKLLKRVHGGAVSIKRTYHFEGVDIRNNSNMDLKKEIARKAVEYVKDGDAIAIDSGSTANLFAMALRDRNYDSLSIVTYSSEVFSILSECHNYKITVTGGEYLPNEKIFYGFLARDAMRQLYYSKAFVVPLAISLQDGMHDFIKETHENQIIMMEHANEVFVLADSTKFETKGNIKICDISPEYKIITDTHLNNSIYNLYKEHNINIIR